jgi:hypothetical protein
VLFLLKILEDLGRPKLLLSFDTIWTAKKTTPVTIVPCRVNVFTEPLPSNDRGIYTDKQTHSSNNSYIVARILCGGNVFTKPLPSNKRGIHFIEHFPNDRRDTYTDTQTDGSDLRSTPFRLARVPQYQVS